MYSNKVQNIETSKYRQFEIRKGNISEFIRIGKKRWWENVTSCMDILTEIIIDNHVVNSGFMASEWGELCLHIR